MACGCQPRIGRSPPGWPVTQARHPVALSRLAYRADTGMVTYQSDKPSGPTAGAETVEALEFRRGW